MKSTGEVMAIGRTIEEGLLKAVRSLEIDRDYLVPDDWTEEALSKELRCATDKRLFAIAEAIRRGRSIHDIADITKWDEFFVKKVKNILDMETALRNDKGLAPSTMRKAKRMGFSDDEIATLTGRTQEEVRALEDRAMHPTDL